jgi:transcription elongation factor Elf1
MPKCEKCGNDYVVICENCKNEREEKLGIIGKPDLDAKLICPACGSQEISPVERDPGYDYPSANYQFQCDTCGQYLVAKCI